MYKLKVKIINYKIMKQKIILIIALIAIGLAGYFYYELYTLRQNPDAVAQKEVKALVAKVSKLAVLPDGETPEVVTVLDPEALKEQAFFANSEKGDKVLIYTQANKAYLYSVNTGKIINIAPLNIGASNSKNQVQTQTPSSETTTDTTTDSKKKAN